MNSRTHGSEDALAQLAIQKLPDTDKAHILVGGLGMGFTLAAALNNLGPQATVDVAELVPAVVSWNRGSLGGCAGNPLADARTTVIEGDVAKVLQSSDDLYDVILLDVDNGPEGLTQSDNDWIYSPAGIAACLSALRANGILAVWSASPDASFKRLLRRSGFRVEQESVRAHGNKGAWHTIWLAQR